MESNPHRKARTQDRREAFPIKVEQCGKWGFHSRKQAKRCRSWHRNKKFDVYRCVDCDMWHLGKPDRASKRASSHKEKASARDYYRNWQGVSLKHSREDWYPSDEPQ